MSKELKQEVKALLESYLDDFRYWLDANMEVDSINSITSGTPSFETIEDAKEYHETVKSVLKELEDA